MKNEDLETDIRNCRSDGDSTLRKVLDETVRYITFLEGKEDRLTAIENKLEQVEKSDLPGKEAFLDQFKEFAT